MKYTLCISVTCQHDPGGVVTIRSVSALERLLRFLLGEKRKLTLQTPGITVSGIKIPRARAEPAQTDTKFYRGAKMAPL